MKTGCRMVLIGLVLTMGVFFSQGFAADKKPYSATPPAKAEKKWRIGYYEGGAYSEYPVTLTATVNALAELGWIDPVTVPDEEDMGKLWAWLSANVRSNYLEFLADAFYSLNWKRELGKPTKMTVIQRLKEAKDIDLMIAMGTWAGQDLANNEHSVPTIVCSVSDALGSKIITSAEDSGYDHVHAQVDPKRFIRQIYAFHDVIGFKKLGVTYVDTVAGRSYAAVDDIKKIAGERNFKVAECFALPDVGATPEANVKVVECAKTLATQIDAFYLTDMACVNKVTLPQIISVMNAAKVPVFSQSGSNVPKGAMLSIAVSANLKAYGKFHAETIAKVMNGAKPRDLVQIYEAPATIAFNKATAKEIDLKDDVYQLLSKTAQEVYDRIGDEK